MATPKLRFKEFDGCWVEKIISEIADVRGGKRLPKGYSLQEENNGFPYITVTDMENGTVNLEKIRYVPLEAIDQIKRYRISVDEIYISVAGTLGLVGIIPQELNNANLTENADKLTNIKCNQFYLLHYLNNGSLSKLIDSVSTIGAQPKLALYAIQGMPIFLPSLDEQTKIAAFLSAVDEKITQLTQKHQLLSQYKQGMMQKLFSQQIRFKADDGSEFDEWKSIQLKDFLTFTPRPVDKPEIAYHALGVRSHFKGLFNKYDSEPQKISMDTLYTVEKDDVVVNITFAWEGAMAIAKDEHNQGLVSHRFPTYKCNESKVNLIFFNYRFIQKDFLSHLQLCSPGGAGRNRVLNKQSFLEISFEKPCVQEQTKIANFLSAIDQKIEIAAQQIEQAKQWKKGLLQQMFV